MISPTTQFQNIFFLILSCSLTYSFFSATIYSCLSISASKSSPRTMFYWGSCYLWFITYCPTLSKMSSKALCWPSSLSSACAIIGFTAISYNCSSLFYFFRLNWPRRLPLSVKPAIVSTLSMGTICRNLRKGTKYLSLYLQRKASSNLSMKIVTFYFL